MHNRNIPSGLNSNSSSKDMMAGFKNSGSNSSEYQSISSKHSESSSSMFRHEMSDMKLSDGLEFGNKNDCE